MRALRVVGRGAWQFDALGYVQARNFNNVIISSTRFVPVLDQRQHAFNRAWAASLKCARR